MTDITDAEQIGWQRQSHRLLGKLLELAAKENLPAVAWRVAHAGTGLLADCFADPPERRRAQFTTWQAAISAAAQQAPETTAVEAPGGPVRLTATWEWLPVTLAPAGGQPLRVRTVVLTASIWPPDKEDESDA